MAAMTVCLTPVRHPSTPAAPPPTATREK